MLRRCVILTAPKKALNLSGTTTKPKRASYVPQGDVKSGKSRLTFMENLRKDRAIADARRELPLLERIKSFPFIPFIVFMSCWSLAGLYVVPWFKGLKGGEYPLLGGVEMTEEQKMKTIPAPNMPAVTDIASGFFGGRGMLSGAEPKIKV